MEVFAMTLNAARTNNTSNIILLIDFELYFLEFSLLTFTQCDEYEKNVEHYRLL